MQPTPQAVGRRHNKDKRRKKNGIKAGHIEPKVKGDGHECPSYSDCCSTTGWCRREWAPFERCGLKKMQPLGGLAGNTG